MQQYRISKYNPALRDSDGNYMHDDWTSVFDIGNVFEGQTFTKKHYLDAEQSYINCVLKIFDQTKLEYLRVTNLNKKSLNERFNDLKKNHSELGDQNFLSIKIVEDCKVNRGEIEIICRMVLRELIWCKLEISSQFFVHFGWDFYMYIGVKHPPGDRQTLLSTSDLFVEKFKSPYTAINSEAPRFVLEEFDRKSEKHIQDIILKKPTFEIARQILELSNEHPAMGMYLLSNKQAETVKKIFKIHINTEDCEYHLDTLG